MNYLTTNVHNYKVYVHENKINGKKYFGITKQKLNRRFNEGKGYKENKRFYSAIQKYGWNNFNHKVLISGISQNEAYEFEKMFIKHYNTTNKKFGYNIEDGGGGIYRAHKNIAHVASPETKRKISLNHADVKKENNPHYNKNGILHAQSKKIINIETNKIYFGIREASRKTGFDSSYISKQCKCLTNISKWRYYDDYVNKLSEKQIKTKYQNKYLENLKVICIETGKIFNTTHEAEKYMNIKSGISECYNGKQKTAGGYHWMKYSDYLNTIKS